MTLLRRLVKARAVSSYALVRSRPPRKPRRCSVCRLQGHEFRAIVRVDGRESSECQVADRLQELGLNVWPWSKSEIAHAVRWGEMDEREAELRLDALYRAEHAS